MRAIVRDFRGCENLDAVIDGVLLIGGGNGAGKSSVCQAIAAAATGVVLPFDGLTKSKAGLLVRDTTAEAVVELGNAEAAARVTWPKAERETRGPFRDASKVSVGLENPVLMTPKDRAAWLVGFLGANPDAAAITGHLVKAGVPAELAGRVLQQIVQGGWDRAHADAREAGARLKGAWEKTTGQSYGSQKAASWRPEHYSEADHRDSEELVEARVIQWRRALDTAIARQAIDAEELARLRELAEQIKPLEAEVETVLRDANAKLAAVELAQRNRAACPPVPDLHDPIDCPHCGGPLIVIGNRVEATTMRAESAAEMIEEIRGRIAVADQELAAARGPAMEAERKLMQVQRALGTAREAAQKLANVPLAAALGENKVAEARSGLAAAEAKRAAWRAVHEAKALAEQIERQSVIVKALAEDGIRQSVLIERLGKFNAELVEVCRDAGWGWVEIKPTDLSISYAGRPYSLCSGGEQFRATATLQVAVARREQAPLMVIDGADVLDRAGRNGLLRALARYAIPTVIGMTIMRREDMPDLGAAGLGRSVWIERGAEAQPAEMAAA